MLALKNLPIESARKKSGDRLAVDFAVMVIGPIQIDYDVAVAAIIADTLNETAPGNRGTFKGDKVYFPTVLYVHCFSRRRKGSVVAKQSRSSARRSIVARSHPPDGGSKKSYLFTSAGECSAEIKLHQYHHAQDKRSCACVPVQQVDITPHE